MRPSRPSARLRRTRLGAPQDPGANPRNTALTDSEVRPQVWIVSTAEIHSGLGFEIRQVFASEHSALYHVEEEYRVAPVLDETGDWNGSAAFGPRREIAIQRVNVQS